MDLTSVLYCLAGMPECMRRDYKVGLITPVCVSDGASFRPGDIVLFSDEEEGLVTVEKPYSPDQIQEHTFDGHLNRTFGTTINFPKEYIDEIKGLELIFNSPQQP